MKIVVTGQTDLRLLSDLLDPTDELPAGMGGIPPAHEIRMLVERGHEVVLVTLDETVTDEIVIRGPSLTVHVGPCRARRGIRTLFRKERRYLTQTIQSVHPDVIHAHWTYEYALAALDSSLPTVVTMHDASLFYLRWNLPQHGGGSIKRRLARTSHWILRMVMAWRVARRSRFNIAVAPHTKDHFARILRCRGEIEVIPNIMNPVLWQQPRQRHADDTDHSREWFQCISVLGTWGAMKNGETLLRAFADVRRSGLNVHLRLLGGDYGPDGAAAKWARRRHLDTDVEFIGRLDNSTVAELMTSSDLLIHPSREESCAMVIAEAQLASLAVMGGSASGGVAWSLGEGEAGLLVDITSAEEIAHGIRTLALDQERRNELAEAGRRLALDRYEPARLTELIEAVLRHCMDCWDRDRTLNGSP